MPRAPGSVPEVLALILRGFPRATADVDVTVLLGVCPAERLVAELRRQGFVPTIEDRTFVATTRVIPVAHRGTGLLVDVVLGGPGLEERFASAAERMKVGRAVVPVATAAHLTVMKVLAGRPKDLDDAAALLSLPASKLDAAEIAELTRALSQALADDGVLANLDEARRRAGRLRRRSLRPGRPAAKTKRAGRAR